MELRAILEILWRRKRVILAVFLSIFLTIMVGTLLVTSWYDATAKVLLRRSTVASSILASLGMQGQSMSTTVSDTDRSDYLSLATVRPVSERVISELRLKRIRTRARIMNAVPFLKPVFKLVGVDVSATEEIIKAEDLTKSSFISYIFPRPYVSVDQYESTDIITLEAYSPDPEQASAMANAMARAFVEDELRRVREDFKGAKDFIQQNITYYNSEYMKSLQTLKEWKEKEKSVNVDTETTDLISKLSDYKKSLEDTKVSMLKIKASSLDIENKLRTMPRYVKDSEQLKSNDTISSMKTTLRDLYVSLAETKTRYTENHPVVVDLQNKINETKRLIRDEAEKVFGSESTSIDPVYRNLTEKLANNYSDLAGYEAQSKVLPDVIKKYDAELMKLPEKSYKYAQMNLAVSVTQDIYNSLLKSLYQVGVAEAIAVSNIYIVETAITPARNDADHLHPNLLLNLVIATFLGGLLGLVSALLVEYLDDALRTSDDVKMFKGLTFLGNIQKLKKKDDRLINAMDPRSPLRESFRTIRNSIRFAALDKPLKSFAVTSSIQEEGKSFFVSNIAISMASDGKRVLIVDGDMRRPNVHHYFNASNAVGLTNYLVGDMGLDKIQIPTSIEGVTIIPTGPIPPDPAKLVESKKMQQLIKDLELLYDIVIVDCPPVFAATDAVFLGMYTGDVLIVIESGRASRKHFGDVLDMFSKANVEVLGAVLNKVSGPGMSYYYYYDYQYKR